LSYLSLVLLLSTATSAEAGLVLTPAGISDGFSLSTFASGFPSNGLGEGPIGIGFPSGGGVMVTSYASGEVVNFATDTDNQLYSGASKVGGYNLPAGLANDGGRMYMAEQGTGNIYQLNNNGTVNHLVTNIGGGVTGLAVNPTNGHLFVSIPPFGDVFDVNPSDGSFQDYSATHGNAGRTADALTFSPDGKTLYAALYNNGIAAYDVASGSQTFYSSVSGIDAGIDGMVLGTGKLAGFIYANTNFGLLLQIKLSDGSQTVIASGGSRGDFVEVDPTNGTLLLTQTDSILRLTPPSGVPEPATFTLAGLGALCLLAFGQRRRKRGADANPPLPQL
jgi:hypothetical protein